MVTVNALTVRTAKNTVLRKISCSLQPGRITSFIGKSGAGKTTLLKALVGLTPTSEEHITINGKRLSDITPEQRAQEMGYVFQEFNLFPNRTVLENCIDPLLVHGMPYNDAKSRALSTLQSLGMETFANEYPTTLSGGQQQRVAIARALGLNPRILLLDEPTASLDPDNTAALSTILQSLAQDGLTIGISSQDMSFVRTVFDRIYYLESGEITEFCDDQKNLAQCPAIKRFLNTN